MVSNVPWCELKKRKKMIRSYKPKDLLIIMDLGNRAWRQIHEMFREMYGEELFQILFPHESTRKGKQVEMHCHEHPEWVFICEEAGKIVGFITFMLDNELRIGEIGNNAVDPDCNLKGIGQQMYKAVLSYFSQQNMVYAKVCTGLDYAHARARNAYERAGFNIHHDDRTYYIKL
jgi:ribosomal protein S18 acetylase RimI-like enzyme